MSGWAISYSRFNRAMSHDPIERKILAMPLQSGLNKPTFEWILVKDLLSQFQGTRIYRQLSFTPCPKAVKYYVFFLELQQVHPLPHPCVFDYPSKLGRVHVCRAAIYAINIIFLISKYARGCFRVVVFPTLCVYTRRQPRCERIGNRTHNLLVVAESMLVGGRARGY